MKEPDRKPPVPKPPRSGAAADDIAGFMPGHEVEEEDSGEEIVVATGPDVAFTKIEWTIRPGIPTARPAPTSSRRSSSGCRTRPASTA